MYELKCEVAIIGAGPAGLSAAVAARKEGAQDVLLIERDQSLGGILQQCIHPGFGLSYFNEELTGPEYVGRFIDEVKELGVRTLLDSMVLELVPEENAVYCVNTQYGMTRVTAKSIVLAMGCRERTRAAIKVPGTRPAGIYNAGAAQRLINRQNIMVGKEVVILGSGDIGMIMARRMTLEGAKVKAVVELNDFLAGLTRNKVQCLDDFGIPLLFGHTVTQIVGKNRVEGVYVAKVDENKVPVAGTEEFIPCDTLLVSVGLIPENELTKKAEIKMSPLTNGPEVNQYMQSSAKCVFACGNVVHVNDRADNVTVESLKAGSCAAKYAMGTLENTDRQFDSVPGCNVAYLCPQHICPNGSEDVKLIFRVKVPRGQCRIVARCGDEIISSRNVSHVNPGEMEYIKLPIDKVSGNVRVDIEEA